MLGQRLKQARIEAGLSQRQLCGGEITRNMLSQIESGKARPSMQTLSYLAQTLGKPVSWFLGETVREEVPPETAGLALAREKYIQKEYESCLEQLENLPEQTESDPERQLLYALSAMALARKALKEGKLRYARSLLEKAGQAGEQTPYFTSSLERERILLLYQAQPETAGELLKALPRDDRELFLRAAGYLALGDFKKSAAVLSAVAEQEGQYHYLMGKALLGQKQYPQATEHFLLAEQAYPRECAQALETCYREQENYKLAYHYACKQRIE